MLRISQIRLSPDHAPEDLRTAVEKKLRVRPGTEFSYQVVRQSVDARKKPDIFYVYTVDVQICGEARILKRAGKRGSDITRVNAAPYRLPERGAEQMQGRPVIVGSGPAGLFCALLLAREGYRPVVIERGAQVEERVKAVERFWEGSELDPDCNVQFGEGGAGTFSDGKLNTSIKDQGGRIRFVLQTFAETGADPDILYSYRPHIGTDRLRSVVKNIREEIISLGGSFLFSHRLEEIEPSGRGYSLQIRDLKRGETGSLHAPIVVLALGHSARDTFEMLHRREMKMEPKAFAVGVRIQHAQRVVDEAMYGKDCRYAMPPSSYKLTCQLPQGGVYSFCMCPGGYVVNASSEPGMTAVNGMSLHDRDSGNANAAIVMTVSPDQYVRYLQEWGTKPQPWKGGESQLHPLTGMAFARMLEKRAFDAGRGAIPAETFADFARKAADPEGEPDLQTRTDLPDAAEAAGITDSSADALCGADAFPGAGTPPRIRGRYVPADVRGIFPEEVSEALEEGIRRFDAVIPGFASDGALLCAPESRTSSPVRIRRDEGTLESVSDPGIYPCGEGAGYAGGITSAAVDGMRVAEAIIRRYALPDL